MHVCPWVGGGSLSPGKATITSETKVKKSQTPGIRWVSLKTILKNLTQVLSVFKKFLAKNFLEIQILTHWVSFFAFLFNDDRL